MDIIEPITEQPVSEQVPSETAELDTENQTSEEIPQAPVEKTFTQKELDEIIQKRLAKAEAKAERRASQAYREALEAVTRSQQPAPAKQVSNEPSREQFSSDAEWIDAKVEYKLQQRENAAKAEAAQASNRSMATKTESLYAQAEKLGGFDRDSFDELPLTPTIAAALIESDVAPQLMVFMNANPDEVERISKLSDARQAVELGKLELKLQTTPKTSKASTPITPVSGSRGGSSLNLESADFAAYKEARAKQGARWAK